jgi:hypothetical protein
VASQRRARRLNHHTASLTWKRTTRGVAVTQNPTQPMRATAAAAPHTSDSGGRQPERTHFWIRTGAT